MMFLIILPLSVPSILDWVADEKPYITNVELPFNTTMIGFEREDKVPLWKLNHIFFKVIDYKFKTYSMEDIERYLQFQIVKSDVVFDENGVQSNKDTNYYTFHTCNKNDFQNIHLNEEKFYNHYIEEKKEKMICVDE